MHKLLIPVAVLLVTLGCESPTSPTTVTTIVTLPTAPTTVPVVTAPGTTTPTCPTATCGGTGTTPTVPRVPDIVSFGADSPRVTHGGAAVLRWEVPDFAASVRIDPGVGSVATTGFVIVFPAVTTTYTLTARNAAGIAQRQFTVFVFTPET